MVIWIYYALEVFTGVLALLILKKHHQEHLWLKFLLTYPCRTKSLNTDSVLRR